MADAKQVLEAKKARLLADAQKQAAEIDHDIGEIERLTALAAKHGLKVVTADENQLAVIINKKPGARPDPESATARAKKAAQAALLAKGTPIRLKALYQAIAERGAPLGGANPHWVLSAILGRDETFMSPERGWWWLSALPVPPKKKKQGDLLSPVPNGTSASH